jgi:GH25 family lysozyme M1 (1,4-beta-N-acetylmuramidase)
MGVATFSGMRKAIPLLLCCLALAPAAPALAAPAAPRLPGIDVSRFNGTIVWPTVAASGIRFAFIAASRGNGADCAVRPESCGADPLFAANRTNAKAAGIRVGAYHRAFMTGTTRTAARADALTEANVFIGNVGTIPRGDLLPVLDVESPFTGISSDNIRAWVKAWMARVKKKLGARTIIYTNTTSWAATGNTTIFARKHPLWVANFGVTRPSVPAGNWGGLGWSVWQYTSSGSVPGVSGRVDLDRLRVPLGKLSF